jgi:hypothetical protein
MASIDEEWDPDPRSNRRPSTCPHGRRVRTPTGRGKWHPSNCGAGTCSRSPDLMLPASMHCCSGQFALYAPGELPIDLLFSFCSHAGDPAICAEGGIDRSRKLGAGFGDGGGRRRSGFAAETYEPRCGQRSSQIHFWKVKWSGSPKLYRRDSREGHIRNAPEQARN